MELDCTDVSNLYTGLKEAFVDTLFKNAVDAFEALSLNSSEISRAQTSISLSKNIASMHESARAGLLRVVNELNNDSSSSTLDFIKYVNNKLTNSQDLMIEEKVLEEVWQIATRLYNENAQDAYGVMLLLCLLEPLRAHVWIALGHCQRSRCEYEGALISYSVACALDPKNHRALIASARSFESLGRLDEALTVAENALKCARESSSYKESASYSSYIRYIHNKIN